MAKYRKWGLPHTVVQIVRAMCVDYDRRDIAMRFNTVSEDVLASYMSINGIIDRALQEVEEGIRREMLNDIIYNRGYNFSPVSPFLAKNTYYSRKRKICYKIAKAMGLWE